MAKITPYDYHSNEDNHGSYQYKSLKDIVNTLELKYSDSDHILKNVRRTSILLYAKEAISEYNKQVFNDVKAIEITVPEKLYFELPHNFVGYVRCSIAVYDENTNSYRLKPLDVNNNINIAEGYLQDHEAEILFDEQGGILTADALNTYNKPYKKYLIEPTGLKGNRSLDTSKFSKYGEFKIDERRGQISFSSDLYDQEIVLEYVSDGLEFDTYGENAITVHKEVVPLINAYVYFSCVEGRNNVSNSEKERARRRLKTIEHQTKLTRSKIDLLQLDREMLKSSKF